MIQYFPYLELSFVFVTDLILSRILQTGFLLLDIQTWRKPEVSMLLILLFAFNPPVITTICRTSPVMRDAVTGYTYLVVIASHGSVGWFFSSLFFCPTKKPMCWFLFLISSVSVFTRLHWNIVQRWCFPKHLASV